MIASGKLAGEQASGSAVALNHDGSVLAVTTLKDSDIALIDVATDTTLAVLSQGGDEVSGLAFSPDGTRILAGGFYRDTLVIWAASQP